MKIQLKQNFGPALKAGDVVEAIQNPKNDVWPRYLVFDEVGCYHLIDVVQADPLIDIPPSPSTHTIVTKDKTINDFFNQELSEMTVRFK